jgi:hypothetical protein
MSAFELVNAVSAVVSAAAAVVSAGVAVVTLSVQRQQGEDARRFPDQDDTSNGSDLLGRKYMTSGVLCPSPS